MALESGGYAEKLGNKYEANWIAYQLLRLLEEKIAWLTVEPIGEDEIGVDVIAGLHNGQCEHHQCKAGSGNREYWTLSQLNQSNILSNAQFQIERGATEFHLVSPLSCKLVSDLNDSADNCNGIPKDFISHQINASKERKNSFTSICDYLNLNTDIDSDVQKAIYFLQRFRVIPYNINQYTKNELEDKASNLFLGNPTKLVSFLKNYVVENNRLRQKITAQDLLNDLRSSGFSTRIIPGDSRIVPVIERLSSDFEDSVKPFLIANQLVSRLDKVVHVLESLKQHAVTLIQAEAGMGKSALLFELHQKLCKQDIISVPVRLDRKRPENNADSFGKSLGFPYSPVLSLSKFVSEKKVVIILDQLDVIRWTAGHSNNALQVCQELVRQVLLLRKEGVGVSIVLACRSFDLNEDVALSSWVSSLKGDLGIIYIPRLCNNIVEWLVSPFEKYGSLNEEKKRILQIPLWLSIYLTIANRTLSAPLFSNKLELIKKYWEDRISIVKSFDIDERDAMRLIDEIVVLMTSKFRLAISANTLTIGTQRALDALLSVGVLTKQGQNISFRHQALFDYQVGLKLFNAGISSASALLTEIGDSSNQTLTKREHLKYALNMLLDSDQRAFCECSSAILNSDEIRFHLKYLTLNTIKEINKLTKPAKLLVDEILEQSNLRSRFLHNTCYKNKCIINYLSEKGVISKWLNGTDEVLIDRALNLLSSIAEDEPQVVLGELSHFVGRSRTWNSRVYRALCWNIEDDSSEMFNLRLRLLSLGCNVGFIDWKSLSKKEPERALNLIELMLSHYKDVLCLPSYSQGVKKLESFSRRDNWSSMEIDEISNIAKLIPETALSVLLSSINQCVGDLDGGDIVYQWLHKERYSNYEPASCLTHGVFSIVKLSGQELAREPEVLFDLMRPYLNNTSPVMNYLLANLLLNLSIEYSDLAIEWLMEYPKTRLSCGNTYTEPKWLLPGKLVEKFSEHCSYSSFNALENEIYYFQPNLTIDKIKWRLEARREGLYYYYWGETQYFLLPKLFLQRTNDKTKQLISVLNRKFDSYSEDDFCIRESSSIYAVTSPIFHPNNLSDKSWFNLITSPRDSINKNRYRFKNGKRCTIESSTEEFARTLDNAVRNEPIRFANLALTLPCEIDKEFIEAFYWGLTETNQSKISEGFREHWQQCPMELIERVIEHFGSSNNERSLARLIESRSEDGLSESTIALLVNIAQTATDPCFDKLNVREIKKSDSAAEADVDTLFSNAINCTRGIAYRGISHIFWEDKGFAINNKNLIEAAINDFHPAVNITAIDLLLSMLNYDNGYANGKFLELCNKDLRMACARGAFNFFNSGFEE
ncbi:hypothetical protein L3V43_00075 [Pseudoalteromonas sp. L23]|uniref:hypothetical protein n=1 Tax=unclassified Pseudoalteromonas TaxID=194690 RepID=UPI001EF138B2|nr:MULTISPECIES: hypothetical protein [unclassified Pseudoalteromonas]MCF7512727.1 hypothetical protein [Pseudoalteromonas sp. L7]MCF7524059.1 hypothetical protein [Pseudoalteromonas sp. L23]MCX2769683.1 hypothetical protein [Pseudoalteromonas sp. B530]